MAAKRKGVSKKKVAIEVDVDTLRKLVDAANALSELAGAWIDASDDPRARALKSKKGARKGRRS
jgi:hypothetical protein